MSSYTCPILGCTSSIAVNHNSLAELDDSSCIAKVEGCTNKLANNYLTLANVDDSTCYHDCKIEYTFSFQTSGEFFADTSGKITLDIFWPMYIM